MSKCLELSTINVVFKDYSVLQVVGHDLKHDCYNGKHKIVLVIDEQKTHFVQYKTYTFLDKDVKEITQIWKNLGGGLKDA